MNYGDPAVRFDNNQRDLYITFMLNIARMHKTEYAHWRTDMLTGSSTLEVNWRRLFAGDSQLCTSWEWTTTRTDDGRTPRTKELHYR